MSKSISGLGTTDLTINELRLLGATFTTLNTSDLSVTGTAQIGNIVISGTFNAEQLTADAITTPELIASGTTSIKAIDDNDDNDNKIAFIKGGTDTGLLKTSTSLYYNPSTDKLAAGGFIGNVTGEVNIETTTPINTGAFRLSFIDGVNDGVTSTGNGLMASSNKLRFAESTGTLIVSNYVTVPILAATTYAAITPTTSTANDEYAVSMFGNGNELTGDSMTYNCFENRLTVTNLQVAQRIYSNLLYMANNADTDADETARIVFKRPTDGILATTIGFAYNSGLNKLLCGGAEFDGNVTATNITATGQVEINRYIATGNSDLNVLFLTAEDKIRIGGSDKPFTFNPYTGVLKSYQLELSNNLNVNCPITTQTGDNRIAFIEATAGTTDYGRGVLSRGTLYWNNNNQTLFCQNILGQALVYTPKLRVTAASGFVAGEFTIDANNGLAANHASSFCVKINSTKQLQISSTETTFFNDVVMNNDLTVNNLTVNNNIAFTNVVANEFRNTFSNLPIGYTATYTCSQYDTLNGTFGMDDSILLNYEASQGGTPTVHQFGGNVTLMNGIVFIRSPIDFGQSSSGQYWRLNGWQSSPTTNQNYVGCWEVTVFAIFQNLSQSRITPKIKLLKYNGVSYEEQTQVTSSTGYTKNGNGSIISMVCNGVVKMTSISRLQLWTRADVNSIPVNTTYPDTVSSTDWTGIDLNISMKYLGFQINVSNPL
jgi:hypothetical protein